MNARNAAEREDLAAENRALKAEHSLSQLCAAFEVKHSGHHAWVKAEASQRNAATTRCGEKTAPCMRGIGGGMALPAFSRN